MKKAIVIFLAVLLCLSVVPAKTLAAERVRLGNEVLLERHLDLVRGKKVGLVTNHTGVNGEGKSLIEVFAAHPEINLVALYGPEHGIDGKAKAGAYVESFTHPTLGIPVYSLYGPTRMPTAQMLENVDVILFDIQDIGSRTYTYMSTLNYVMQAAKKYGKPVIVLDRPNPVGGVIVEGPVLEDKYISFVGVDNLPMAHGMTAGELALYFNRKIGADITVIKMEGYYRDMIFQDTGLVWVQTSPNIPTLESAFGYMATGLGEGTGIHMRDKFTWIGGRKIDQQKFADLLNQAGLPGVVFVPESINGVTGVRLKITDYHAFNPARTGFYALAYAKQLTDFPVPKSGNTIVMFDKIMGTDKVGKWLEQGLSPQQIEANYRSALEAFKKEREKYLLYPARAEAIVVNVNGVPVEFDAKPMIKDNRVLVPLRAIAEALGCNVDWSAGGRTVTISKAGQEIVFTIGSTQVLVNGENFVMDTVPLLNNNRTFIPARYIGEYLGATVTWHEETKTVDIW
ncbi:MAG: DUF1343 domain-containing protein [Firmicutes bacterium]|nr:DUF1343 domain-containing protein [Bacillota bacterium]